MINTLKKEIDKELRMFLSEVSKVYGLRERAAFLAEGVEDFIKREGKRIRPILFLLAYQGYEKRKTCSYQGLLRASISFELLHDFLLIHDDVIDRSSLRRGKPTLHYLFSSRLPAGRREDLGSSLGIVAGDVVFALAVSAFLAFDGRAERKGEALGKFLEAAAFTGVGEFMDIMNGLRSINDVDEKDVFLTYEMKTAKYTFEMPLVTGAMLAGANKGDLEGLAGIGVKLGEAFQIIDDLQDMFMTSREIGKPALSDLIESKKTLAVYGALQALKSKEKKRFSDLFDKKKKTKSDLYELKRLVIKSGSPLSCVERVRSLLDEVSFLISSLGMKKEFKKVLGGIMDKFRSNADELDKRIHNEI